MNLSRLTIARTRSVAVIAAVTGTLTLLTVAPAAAAGQPDDHAPCLAAVFQAQAVAAPRTVSDRIHVIRTEWLQGLPFGQALKPLATAPYDCPE